ncbi:amidohydrolase family protein [Nonomuraea sp. KC401]|uniref:Amidohydrolase family protein n=1 Tax=Nonomuraea longispora TaxID=1848320 RepID=A0A4R4NDB6_9ACTN|nr:MULTISPECIES: amidohydrolase family protein [Nonomuraea]NBE96439.1 amidohydrolase family protein [Nonomuraea sp. K271]TDC05147.1 amidohydrolase family protein [Nonomuraea longispora]TLF54574.1 amidohydrolase family protein [Nonomuraea sp. KC401]
MRIIRAARVLTGRPGEVIAEGEVLIDGATIVSVGPRGSAGEAGEVVELPGHTVLPGLVDAHVHLGFDATVDPVTRRSAESDHHLLLRMAENARKLVSAGVTTARDLGGRDFLDLALRDAIEEGLAVGPHLVAATRPITITGGHCWYMGGEADDEVAIRRVARENLRAGADCLKVMASGGQMTPGAPPSWVPQYTTEQLRVVVEEAGARGKGVAAHAHAHAAIRSALEAGVTTIEHCSFFTPSGHRYDAELADLVAAGGTYVCPTLHGVFWRSREVLGAEMLDDWLSGVAAMREAGVRLIAGTDAGFVSSGVANRADGFVASLEVFAEAGFGNAEIIELATVRAADACGVGEAAGSLEAGKRADLIAVAGDPLTCLSDLRNLALVLVSGRSVSQTGVDTVTSSAG